VLIAEEEDIPVKGSSKSSRTNRKKTLQKWKEGIEVGMI